MNKRLAAALVAFPALFACKQTTQGDAFQIKGLTAEKTSKEIDYKSFYDTKTKELAITHVIAFESSHKTGRGTPAGNDQGTEAAYKLIKWVKNEGVAQLFRAPPEVESDEFPENQNEVRIGATYRFVAKMKAVPLDFPGRPEGVPATADVKLRIVLGTSLAAAFDSGPSADQRGGVSQENDACAEGEGSNFDGRGYAMPAAFCNELARALVEDDLVSYNGHIWVSESEMPRSIGEPAEVGATTLKLVKKMQELRRANGSRAKQSIIYMNACHAERIEQKLMEGLLDQGAPETSHPILLSHRNYSNFGFFAEHDANLMIDVLNGQPLAKVMLDLTTTLKPHGNETKDEAKKKLGDYVVKAEASGDPNQVIVVAYDLQDGRLTPGAL